jgi:sensor c-di-GMP phosphodiesterase-like protein
VDQLKIDRSFVGRLATDESAAAIVLASINLASDLGLSTVAEGIEDPETIGTLSGIGCSEAQGFYISRPVPLHDFMKWARQWDPATILDRCIGSPTDPGAQPIGGVPAGRPLVTTHRRPPR